MDKITNTFIKRMEAGLMEESSGLCDEEREELN